MSSALQRFVHYFETLTPETARRADEIYAPCADFVDPFNTVRGGKAVAQVFGHMFGQVDEPRFRVLETYETDTRAMLIWEFRFRFRGESRIRVVEGASRVEFDDSGRVVSHHDHWDAAGQLYAQLPLLGPLLRWLRRRMSASA